MTRVTRFIDRMDRWIAESGGRVPMRSCLEKASATARRMLEAFEDRQGKLRTEINGKVEASSNRPAPYTALPVLVARDRRVRSLLSYSIVAFLLLELIIGFLVASILFWMLPFAGAVAASMGFALLLALAAHGFAGSVSDQTRPLRQRRLYRTWIIILVIVVSVALVPIALSRMILLPAVLTNVALGICALLLPVVSGVSSAFRQFLTSEFIAPVQALIATQRAIATLKDAIARWERDLAESASHKSDLAREAAA